MRLKKISLLFYLVAFVGLVQVAQAGIIRYTGKEIAKGASSASQATETGGAALAGSTAAAGHATADAASDGFNAAEGGVASATGSVVAAGASTGDTVTRGASGITKALKQAPDAVGDGARSAARKVWHTIW